MECIEAQTTISEALDGTPIDAAWLSSAKFHCHECETCRSFVRALAVVKRAPLPQPPSDLVSRVMVAVRSEAAAEAEQLVAMDAAAVAPAVQGPSESVIADGRVGTAGETDPLDGASHLIEELEASALAARSRRETEISPIALGVWASLAAVFLVGIGALAAIGINEISTGAQKDTAALDAQATAGSTLQESAPAPGTPAAGAGAPAAPQTSSADYIAFNGFAYRLVGTENATGSPLANLGTITSSLGSNAASSRQVKGSASNSARIYLQDDKFQLLAFEPVVRDYNGRSYRLTTGDIAAFGTWPTLPARFVVPTSPDGTPTFTSVEGAIGGLTMYRLTTGSVAEGIAIAPGSAASDPAAGNPNWTWWTPAK